MTTRRDILKYAALDRSAAHFPLYFDLDSENQEYDPRLYNPYTNAGTESPKPRTITIPDVDSVAGGKKYKVLKGDFHIHTHFSDGQVSPEARVQEAIQNGFDCIALTDHVELRAHRGFKFPVGKDNHNAAYRAAKPVADENDLLLFHGVEITKFFLPPGHINAIFITDANPIARAVDDWRRMVALAVEQGGFIIWNHPGEVAPLHGGLAPGVPMSFTQEHQKMCNKGHLHAVEIFNDTHLYPIVSDWCNERDLGILAVSDIHASELQTYGMQNPRRPMTLVLAEERTEESVREAFFARRTIAWVANMIFGRPEWVRKLFAACVEIDTVNCSAGTADIKNKSDIFMYLQVRNRDYALYPQENISIPYNNGETLCVMNWFVGTNKPLEYSAL